MEMILNLPRNYVEIEEEEMMYLDGGSCYTLKKNLWGIYNRLASYAAKTASGATIGSAMKRVGLTWSAIGRIAGSYWSLVGKVVAMISSVTRFLGTHVWLIGAIAGMAGFALMWNFRLFY